MFSTILTTHMKNWLVPEERDINRMYYTRRAGDKYVINTFSGHISQAFQVAL